MVSKNEFSPNITRCHSLEGTRSKMCHRLIKFHVRPKSGRHWHAGALALKTTARKRIRTKCCGVGYVCGKTQMIVVSLS